MVIRWLSASIDRPHESVADTARFWATVTGTALTEPSGCASEFATLSAEGGDPYLRVQRVAEGPGGCHLHVHVDDPEVFAATAADAGAVVTRKRDASVVLRSPAGLAWCVVAHDGERARPGPQFAGQSGHLHLLDQLCIDIPAARFDEECAFWQRLTGWALRDSTVRPEFRFLARPAGCPLRLLLQRCDDDRPARAHLDVSSSDVSAVVAHHEALGARTVARFAQWTVLLDPSGHAYCVTARNPRTGRLDG